jgi:ribosomal protein S18 acetylase RimI-like enzyme
MESISIVPVSISDLIKLQTISRSTFKQTFDEHNNSEDMETYLNASFSAEKLSAELNNKNSKFYFAINNEVNEVVGYLKVNTGDAQSEKMDLNAFEIERIYVDKAYFGKKVGQLLFNKAIEIAKSIKVSYVWLGVWEENHRALAFYTKNGFIAFDKHIFKLGNDEQTDIMMKLTLD